MPHNREECAVCSRVRQGTNERRHGMRRAGSTTARLAHAFVTSDAPVFLAVLLIMLFVSQAVVPYRWPIALGLVWAFATIGCAVCAAVGRDEKFARRRRREEER
jgi:hypothetical protein